MTKILIAEDDLMISEIYQKKFTDSGFAVSVAVSGPQVLQVAEKEKPDVILLDLIMPKMDGFEVIEKIRGGDFDPNIKIIISSNLSQNEDRDRAVKLGANGFIAKSDFSPGDLVNEVKRLLGQYDEHDKNINNEKEDLGSDSDDDAKDNSVKKVLLIEDEKVFIEMFGDRLRQDGYYVATAENGAWGAKEALKEKFDLFIIDMVMPAMTGEEIITKLKMEDETKNIPIIVLSASVEDEAIKRVKEMGINEFFVKTQITPSELSKRVKEILK